MKYAVISDIHANIEALTEVLLDCEYNRTDKIICLGDVVGYGPNPNECCELIRKKCELVLMGNHDHAIFNDDALNEFTKFAKEAIEYQRKMLNPENINWLKTLPFSFELSKEVKISQSTFENPEGNDSIRGELGAKYEFPCFKNKIGFFGHTHEPVIYHKKNIPTQMHGITETIPQNGYKLEFSNDMRYLINPGSVGQPRDRNIDASYLIYDIKDSVIVFKRVPYDVNKTKEKIYSIGLSGFIANRLSEGE